MSLDDLKPQSPRTAANTRLPGPANAYGERALAATRDAQAVCRTRTDIAFGPDYYQKLDLYLPDDDVRDAPVLLFFHGGAWQHGYKEWCGHMAPAFIDLPAVFVAASYRKVPEAKFPAPLEDAFMALQWVWRNVAEHGGDPDRIFAAGWSVGGTLASLVTLRRDLYGGYGLPDDVVKACLAASSGYRYPADVPAPGNSGVTYGELMYQRPEDEALAEPLRYVAGNRTPFHISHGENDFAHVMASSADMVEALKAAGSAVTHEVFGGMDHYRVNLAQGNKSGSWVRTARAWMTASPKG
jgi:acetyl esterase/lipase